MLMIPNVYFLWEFGLKAQDGGVSPTSYTIDTGGNGFGLTQKSKGLIDADVIVKKGGELVAYSLLY